MLASFICDLLIASLLMLLAGWASDALRASTARRSRVTLTPQVPRLGTG